MKDSLEKLIKLMPPLQGQRHTKVNWPFLEEQLRIRYPQSFKDFVSVYGSSHWFDKLLPIFADPATPEEAQSFKETIQFDLNWIDENHYDENYGDIEVRLYPQEGGLFPFLNDIDGPMYCWATEGKDAERWPVHCWLRGPIIVLQNMSISDMFMGYFERSPEMVRVWGDIQDLAPDRLRIDDRCAD